MLSLTSGSPGHEMIPISTEFENPSSMYPYNIVTRSVECTCTFKIHSFKDTHNLKLTGRIPLPHKN